MSMMTIRVTNASFESSSSGEFESVDDAYRAGLISGLSIASDEIAGGSPSAIVQVTVDLEGRPGVARGSVAVSTAPLLSLENGSDA